MKAKRSDEWDWPLGCIGTVSVLIFFFSQAKFLALGIAIFLFPRSVCGGTVIGVSMVLALMMLWIWFAVKVDRLRIWQQILALIGFLLGMIFLSVAISVLITTFRQWIAAH